MGAAVHAASVACTADQHQLCDLAGFDMFLHQFQADTELAEKAAS